MLYYIALNPKPTVSQVTDDAMVEELAAGPQSRGLNTFGLTYMRYLDTGYPTLLEGAIIECPNKGRLYKP